MDCRECDYWLCATCCPQAPARSWAGGAALPDLVAGEADSTGVASVLARAERMRQKTEAELKREAEKAADSDFDPGVRSNVAIESAVILLPDSITDLVAQYVPFPGPRPVCQRWRLALDWHWCLELAWAMQWREHLFLAGDAFVRWKHKTEIEMSAFFDRRSYHFTFGQDGSYRAHWDWMFGDDFGVDYSSECFDCGRWSLDGCRLVLQSGPKSPRGISTFLERCQQPNSAKIVQEGRHGWVPLSQILCGRTSSTWAAVWENDVKLMALPEGRLSDASLQTPT